MQINKNNHVSITEAQRDFSSVVRLVDTKGPTIILKNNVPCYVLMEYNQFENQDLKTADDVGAVARRILNNNRMHFWS